MSNTEMMPLPSMFISKGERTHLSHLVLSVGNNGCGPGDNFGKDSWRHLSVDIQEKLAKSKQIEESLVLCYAGQYDILVHPGGSFCLIPNHLEHFTLTDDKPVYDNMDEDELRHIYKETSRALEKRFS